MIAISKEVRLKSVPAATVPSDSGWAMLHFWVAVSLLLCSGILCGTQAMPFLVIKSKADEGRKWPDVRGPSTCSQPKEASDREMAGSESLLMVERWNLFFTRHLPVPGVLQTGQAKVTPDVLEDAVSE